MADTQNEEQQPQTETTAEAPKESIIDFAVREFSRDLDIQIRALVILRERTPKLADDLEKALKPQRDPLDVFNVNNTETGPDPKAVFQAVKDLKENVQMVDYLTKAVAQTRDALAATTDVADNGGKVNLTVSDLLDLLVNGSR